MLIFSLLRMLTNLYYLKCFPDVGIPTWWLLSSKSLSITHSFLIRRLLSVMTCLAEQLEFTTAGATKSGGSFWKWIPLPRHAYRLDVVSYCWRIKESGTVFFFGKQMLRALEICGETQQDIPRCSEWIDTLLQVITRRSFSGWFLALLPVCIVSPFTVLGCLNWHSFLTVALNIRVSTGPIAAKISSALTLF